MGDVLGRAPSDDRAPWAYVSSPPSPGHPAVHDSTQPTRDFHLLRVDAGATVRRLERTRRTNALWVHDPLKPCEGSRESCPRRQYLARTRALHGLGLGRGGRQTGPRASSSEQMPDMTPPARAIC